MSKNYLEETTFKEFNIDIFKEALVYNVKRLKHKVEDQRENWYILLLTELYIKEQIGKKQIKLKKDNKL